MDVSFEFTYRTNSRDADTFCQCRPSSLLGYLQEAATGAAEAGGFTRESLMERYDCFWMLARIWYRLDRPVYWNRDLTIRTWHRANTGMMMYRDFDLYLDGQPVGEAVSIWVLANKTTRKLMRMSHVQELAGTGGGALCKEMTLQKLKIPEGLSLAEERTLHYSDTDLNGHVNNSRYADFACDAIRLDRVGRDSFVSALQIGFLAECRAGETLGLFTGRQEGLWYIEGQADGTARFDAAITLSPLDNR